MAFSMIAIISSKILRLNLLEQSIVKACHLAIFIIEYISLLAEPKAARLAFFRRMTFPYPLKYIHASRCTKIISRVKEADSPLAQDEIRKEVVWKNAEKPRTPRQKNADRSQKINSKRYFS